MCKQILPLSFSLLFFALACADAQIDPQQANQTIVKTGIEAIPASLNFGIVAVNTSKEMSLAIQNHETKEVALVLSVNNPAFTILSANPPSVPAGGISTIVLVFSPTLPGAVSDNILMSAETLSQPLLVPISGTGGGSEDATDNTGITTQDSETINNGITDDHGSENDISSNGDNNDVSSNDTVSDDSTDDSADEETTETCDCSGVTLPPSECVNGSSKRTYQTYCAADQCQFKTNETTCSSGVCINGECQVPNTNSCPDSVAAEEVSPNDAKNSTMANIAFNGSDYGVIYKDDRTGKSAQYFALIGKDGTVKEPGVILRTSVKTPQVGRISAAGNNFFAVWEEMNETNTKVYDIYYSLISNNGQNITTNILFNDPNMRHKAPDAEYNGSNVGVAFRATDLTTSTYKIMFGVADTNGNTVVNPVVLSDVPEKSADRPRIAWNGENFGITWKQYPAGQTIGQVWFRAVSATGTPIGTATMVSNTPKTSDYLGIAADPAKKEWVMVWHAVNATSGKYEVYFARINANGNVAVQPKVIVTSVDSMQYPDVTFNGKYYGVVYRRYVGITEFYVHTIEVDSNGDIKTPDTQISLSKSSSGEYAKGQSAGIAGGNNAYGIIYHENLSILPSGSTTKKSEVFFAQMCSAP